MKISIIIPACNEEKTIAQTIAFFKKNTGSFLSEIIVVDGGSEDNSVNISKNSGAIVYVSPVKSRAAQMNLGASKALGDIFYFVHADTIPPDTFASDIIDAFNHGYESGCYRLKLASTKKIFIINEWFTRLDKIWCRGGDQTLFVTRKLFDALQGFNPYFVIMEEYDFITRAKHKSKFKIMPKNVLASARKYDNNNWLKVMTANYKAYKMFRNKVDPKKIKDYYLSALK